MNSRIYKVLKTKSEEVDKMVRKQYSASFLNNTKWYKLINELTLAFDEIYILYKLIYDENIAGFPFTVVDFEPYFLEPIRYKEVEWIEFPKTYENWLNLNNHKAGKKTITQDLNLIFETIERIGVFKLERNETCIRIYAYI